MKNKETNKETIFRAVEPGETPKGFHFTLTDLNDGKAIIDEDISCCIGSVGIKNDKRLVTKSITVGNGVGIEDLWVNLKFTAELCKEVAELLDGELKKEAEEKQTSEKESEAQSN